DAKLSDTEAIQAVWDASSSHDDPARAVGSWASSTQVLVLDGRVIGVAAVRAEPAPDGAMPARIALEAAARHEDRAVALVQASVDLVRAAGGERIRLYVPARTSWLRTAAQQAGFSAVRTIAHLIL